MNTDPTQPFQIIEEGLAYLAFIILLVVSALVIGL